MKSMPILLFNDECNICTHIAHWVKKSARTDSDGAVLSVRPIGSDPEALRLLKPGLDIWDAYATLHLLMPDGSTRLGGEAVAEVLRSLPNTKWFARSFSLRVFGFRPFQVLLDAAYGVLARIRPLLGCESCGTPSFWVRPIGWVVRWSKSRFPGIRKPNPNPHFASRSHPAGAIASPSAP
jgi:predicted DCC family thiol-disulfide oxidoreductase YuxK